VENVVIDAIDSDILHTLQRNARLTNRELGRLVGLSPNAAGARVQRLQEKGVITGFTARINHAALGRPMEVSIDVWQTDDRNRSAFTELAAEDDRIVECFHLTGPLDFRVRARVSSAEDLNDLLIAMQERGAVRQTDSRLVLEHLPTAGG